MKLIYNSGNEGLDYFLEYCYGMNLNYDADEVIEFLIFIDQLDVETAEEMLGI